MKLCKVICSIDKNNHMDFRVETYNVIATVKKFKTANERLIVDRSDLGVLMLDKDSYRSTSIDYFMWSLKDQVHNTAEELRKIVARELKFRKESSGLIQILPSEMNERASSETQEELLWIKLNDNVRVVSDFQYKLWEGNYIPTKCPQCWVGGVTEIDTYRFRCNECGQIFYHDVYGKKQRKSVYVNRTRRIVNPKKVNKQRPKWELMLLKNVFTSLLFILYIFVYLFEHGIILWQVISLGVWGLSGGIALFLLLENTERTMTRNWIKGDKHNILKRVYMKYEVLVIKVSVFTWILLSIFLVIML